MLQNSSMVYLYLTLCRSNLGKKKKWICTRKRELPISESQQYHTHRRERLPQSDWLLNCHPNGGAEEGMKPSIPIWLSQASMTSFGGVPKCQSYSIWFRQWLLMLTSGNWECMISLGSKRGTLLSVTPPSLISPPWTNSLVFHKVPFRIHAK